MNGFEDTPQIYSRMMRQFGKIPGGEPPREGTICDSCGIKKSDVRLRRSGNMQCQECFDLEEAGPSGKP